MSTKETIDEVRGIIQEVSATTPNMVRIGIALGRLLQRLELDAKQSDRAAEEH